MPARFQLVIDCKDPELLARFWAAALGYVLEPPPEGFATWDDWRRDIGLPDSELGIGADSIIDSRGDGPRIWFHVMPDAKVAKNRLHLDIHVSGFPSRSDPLATRMQRVDAEARRLTDLGGRLTVVMSADGLDHYAVGMKDPEGNEFALNGPLRPPRLLVPELLLQCHPLVRLRQWAWGAGAVPCWPGCGRRSRCALTSGATAPPRTGGSSRPRRARRRGPAEDLRPLHRRAGRRRQQAHHRRLRHPGRSARSRARRRGR